MFKINKQHTFLFFFLLVFLSVIPVNAQEKQLDTLAMVKGMERVVFRFINQQDYAGAQVILKRITKLTENSINNDLRAEGKLMQATFNYYLEDYKHAANKIAIAIEQLEDSENKNLLGQVYLLNGLILSRIKKYEASEAFILRADEIFKNLNDEPEQANVLLAKGILELQKENSRAAVNYFDAALPVFQNFTMEHEIAFANINKANALLQLTEGANTKYLMQAKISSQIALDIIDKKGYPRLLLDNYNVQAAIALRENEPLKAEQYFKLYKEQQEVLYEKKLEALSSGFNSETNIGDLYDTIDQQKSDLDKQKKSIIFNQATTSLSIALILILSLLTLSLYKNNRLRAKANNLLRDKTVELTLAKEKAEKAMLAKAQFLSTITHELRTPLYAVTGLTHLLLEESPQPNQKEHLNSLKFSGDYLLSLINNILDLNKLEANKVEIEKTTFNLKKRISDVLIALKKSAEDRNNTLHYEFDESIPQKISGDSLKLSQVLINLIGNSVKFTQNGSVTIRVNRLDSTIDKVQLHFEIEDTGVGISMKKQKSIFETFSQGSLQINRKFGGTGLGLSIVKNLLELMNSRINLESVLGQGSKFWFNLTFDVVDEFNKDGETVNLAAIDYSMLEDKNILVVEDNKINQMITKKILEKNNMICMVADNGKDAIELFKNNRFDVILMDIHMPGISGIEATQKIRLLDKNIPIIALTAVTIDENLDDFYRAGFNEIIPKPFKPEDFFDKISRTLLARNSAVNN